MARRGGLKGRGQFKALIRALPEGVRLEIVRRFEGSAARLLGTAKTLTPVRTGGLRTALAAKVLPESITLKLGLLTRATQRGRFYGYILDRGRKAQRARIKRGPRKGSYMNVSPIPRGRYDIVFGRMRDYITQEYPKMRDLFETVLARFGAR